MAYNQNTDQEITLQEAKQKTHQFQHKFPEEPVAHKVSAESLKKILDQEECKEVRIYQAYDENEDTRNLVLVGVDEAGNDLTQGVIIDRLDLCPVMCDEKSELKLR